MAEPSKILSSYARITTMLMKSQVGHIALNDPIVTKLESDLAIQFLKLGSHIGIEGDLDKVTAQITHLENINIAIDTANKTATNKINLSKLPDSTKFSADQIKYQNEVKETQEKLITELKKLIQEINQSPDVRVYLTDSQASASISDRILARKRQVQELSQKVEQLEEQLKSSQRQGLSAYKEVYDASIYPRQVTPGELAKSTKVEAAAATPTATTSRGGPEEGKPPELSGR